MPYKYKGEDISEEFVTEGFENSSFTILDDYISDTNGLEVVEEKVGKTSGVAVKDATVTSKNPEQASENTELEQVDTSSELEDPKPKKSVRGQIRARELASRKKAIDQKKQKELILKLKHCVSLVVFVFLKINFITY